MAENVGTLSRLAVDDAGPGSLFMEFIDHNIKCYTELARDNGIRGTRSRYANRNRTVKEWVRGSINMNPSALELDFWLAAALGLNTTGTFSLTEALPSIYIIEDKGDTVHEWPVCYVDTFTISGSAGQPLTVSAAIEGKTETKDGASFPSVNPGTQSMFVMKDSVLTLGGTAREMEQFTLKIDNVLDKERWMNSLTRGEIPSLDRIVTLSATLPWNGDTDDLYGVAVTGIEGSLVIADGTTTYTATFGTLSAPKEGPDTRRAGERFTINFNAEHDGTNKEVVIVKS
jgi:hypothetical protein